MMAKLVAGLLALSELALINAVDKEQSIEELMTSMKGMPGMEGIKMFTVCLTQRTPSAHRMQAALFAQVVVPSSICRHPCRAGGRPQEYGRSGEDGGTLLLCEAGWTACQSCNLSTTAGPLKHRDGCVCAQGMFGNGPKKPKKQTRSQYRRRLVDFYEKYGLADKVRLESGLERVSRE